MKNAACTVLVTSCDAYRDVESPFLALFRRYWPDCPFALIVNGETDAEPGFDRAILSGRGKPWCQMLTEALDQIATPYVLLLMNDYFLAAPVDTARILKRLEQAQRFDAANLRLNPNPPGRRPFGSPADELLEMPKNVAYCVTCQTGIWNRDYLRGLAARNKSAWEFERRGSFDIAGETRPLLVTPTKEFPFLDAVHKGCWEPFGVRVLKENGISCDFTKRGLPPWRTRLVEGLKGLVFRLVPTTLLVRVQNALDVGAKEKPA